MTVHHATTALDHALLHRFWEIEETSKSNPALTSEERTVVRHFEEQHTRSQDGHFIGPLTRKADAKDNPYTRKDASQMWMRWSRNTWSSAVPDADLSKDPRDVFYLPAHVVYKDSSTTTLMHPLKHHLAYR